MHLHLKYQADTLFRKVLAEELREHGIDFTFSGGQTIQLASGYDKQKLKAVEGTLKACGIEIIQDEQSLLIQQIKDLLSKMVTHPHSCGNQKVSAYLTDQLPYSYSYLSKTFSEYTHYSIEQYLILTKIDVAKNLLVEDKLSLTEIAYRLNYCSVAHLSKQFKKNTGLTPTAFYELIKKRESSRS